MPAREEQILIERIRAVLEGLGWSVTKTDVSGPKIILQIEHDKPKPETGA